MSGGCTRKWSSLLDLQIWPLQGNAEEVVYDQIVLQQQVFHVSHEKIFPFEKFEGRMCALESFRVQFLGQHCACNEQWACIHVH